MKTFLSLLILLPVIAFSQDCKLIRETDVYTKEPHLSTGFIQLQMGASVTVDSDGKEIDFFFSLPGQCFNDASTVFIFFEGTKVKSTYRNAGSVNCEGYFHFKYRNTETSNTVLNKLTTMNVVHFIFTGADKKPVTIALLPDQQEKFKAQAACLVAEAKKLIKT